MFLAMTADRRFMAADPDTIFLGLWCLPESELAGARSPRIVPYAFDDRARLHQAYRYLDRIYPTLISGLGEVLNELHATSHSTRYWEIVAGYWLRLYIEILYERHACLSAAREVLGAVKVRLLPPDAYRTVGHSLEFDSRCVSDLYNQQIYSQIIEHIGGFALSYADLDPAIWRTRGAGSAKHRVRTIAKNTIRWVSLLGSKWNTRYLCATYLPPRDLVATSLRLRLFPTVDTPPVCAGRNGPCDDALRRELGRVPANDDFERLVVATLPINLPRAYLEDFAAVGRFVRRFYPKKTRLVLTANSFAVNETFKRFAAEQVERHNTPYVIHQHGGHYGCGLWNSSEDYETRVADRYLSYGWDDPARPKIQSFYASRIAAPTRSSPMGKASGDILWILASFPRYAYTMYATPSGPHFRTYLEEQGRFVKNLSASARCLLKCRLYPISYGWRDMETIARIGGPVTLDECKITTKRRMNTVRLCICTYNATAHLESFAANIPTILFWNPAYWEIRAEAREIMSQLHSAGVLCHTPEAAARTVDNIMDDTFGWWAQPKIQRLRYEFCQRFARTHPRPARVWSQWIREHGAP